MTPAILHAIETVLGITPVGVLGRSRVSSVAHARKCGYYLARHVYGWGWHQVGRAFGRGHQPAIVGCRRIEWEMRHNGHLVCRINEMAAILRESKEQAA